MPERFQIRVVHQGTGADEHVALYTRYSDRPLSDPDGWQVGPTYSGERDFDPLDLRFAIDTMMPYISGNTELHPGPSPAEAFGPLCDCPPGAHESIVEYLFVHSPAVSPFIKSAQEILGDPFNELSAKSSEAPTV